MIITDLHHQSIINNQSSIHSEPLAHNLWQSVLICGQPKPRAAPGSAVLTIFFVPVEDVIIIGGWHFHYHQFQFPN